MLADTMREEEGWQGQKHRRRSHTRRPRLVPFQYQTNVQSAWTAAVLSPEGLVGRYAGHAQIIG
jgi:hypothetical protein